MKTISKKILLTIATILVAPLLLIFKSLNWTLKSDRLFASFSQLLSLIPGKSGNYLRASFYRFTLPSGQFDVVISFLTLLFQRDTEIGSGVYIGPQCNIGKCRIGKNTLLGSGVHVMSGKNQHTINSLEIPIKNQGGCYEKVSIGEDCWVGNGALIMANIGNQCVVGAGSVVISDIPDYSIVGGNPAKVIRSRKPSAALNI